MELNISLRKLQKYFLSYSVIMGIVYIGSFLTRFRSYFLFHSIYAIFLFFLLGVFAVLFLDYHIQEEENSREVNLKLTLYNFGLFYSLTMGVFTFFYYQGTLPRDLITIRNILLPLISIDVIGLLFLSWKEGASRIDNKTEQKMLPQEENSHKTLEGVFSFMEDNARILHKMTFDHFYESKRRSRDLALLSAILTLIILIPLTLNIDRYVYFINLFIIQYGLIVLFAVFFSSFLYHQISFMISKYNLIALERYREIQDKVYCFLSCIHRKPVQRERKRKEKYFYIYWTALALIPISILFFYGVIPPTLRATRLISLVSLVVLVLVYRRKLRIQKDYYEHVETIGDIEVRPRSHIEEMSQLDKNTFFKMYSPLLKGDEEVQYDALLVSE